MHARLLCVMPSLPRCTAWRFNCSLCTPALFTAARDKRVLQQAPTHLPHPEWTVREAALLSKAEAAGVPAGPGAPFKWKRSAHMHTGRLVEM